jgi:hypothetical protein
MNSHQLSVSVLNLANTCVLYLVDTSIYAENIPVDCPTLQIQAPGFTDIVTIEVQPGFNNYWTACDLELQLTNCENLASDLPDGIYVIRYSVSPNETMYVEYNHLRIAKLLKMIHNLLCCLDVPDCEPQGEIAKKIKEISELRVMLMAAVANAEYCHKPTKAMAIYNYVMKEVKKLSCSCGCEQC